MIYNEENCLRYLKLALGDFESAKLAVKGQSSCSKMELNRAYQGFMLACKVLVSIVNKTDMNSNVNIIKSVSQILKRPDLMDINKSLGRHFTGFKDGPSYVFDQSEYININEGKKYFQSMAHIIGLIKKRIKKELGLKKINHSFFQNLS
ncbi:MAG: hypothetical protein JW827_10630 [Spirochaetes bacterium]|nr:hypothetical protein [Spirochaetota bacterium]